jgi:hypothetical protein
MTRLKTHRRPLGILILLGLLLSLAIGATITLGQENAPPNLGAEYVGADRCETCHNKEVGPIWDTWNATSHAQTLRPADAEALLGDFSATDLLTITWPDGEERPVTPSEITYVIGGRYTQKYLSVIEGEEGNMGYYVLPITWNIAQQENQTSTWTVSDDDSWLLPENDWRITCAGCHTTGWNPDRVTADFTLVEDWHEGDVEIGINCEDCHGPAGDHDGGRGALPRLADAQICAQCHSQGHAPGTESPFPVDYQPGLPFDETVFVMADENDPDIWWSTGHASASNAQYNEWLKSGHATSLTSVLESEFADDSCLRCHAAPPDATDLTADTALTLETAQYGVTCVACHNPHPSESVPQQPPSIGDSSSDDKLPNPHTTDLIGADDGKRDQGTDGDTEEEPVYAEEPLPYLLQAEDTYALCITCHNGQTPEGDMLLVGGAGHHPVQEMYEGQAMIDSIDGVVSGHFAAENGPECIDCHMPHTATIGEFGELRSHTLEVSLPENSDQSSSCNGCHSDLSPGYLQRFVADMQTETSERLHEIEFILNDRPDTEQWITDTINFVVGDGSLGVHNYAYTDALLNEVEIALRMTNATNGNGNGTSYVNYLDLEDPATCEECHRDETHDWEGSPHANSSMSEHFLADFASQGRPTYCMSCHASGYNPETNTYAYEGVVCSRCHTLATESEHPPAPVEIADTPELCGQCHSGAHAPTYDEWLVSDHNVAGVDCIDCHTPHNNGLILGDVNSTCGDCHQEALVDDIHMGDDMTCVDCHMTRRTTGEHGHVLTTGHTMAIDPGVCSECHGNTHLLSAEDYNRTPEEIAGVQELEAEIAQLEDIADENRYANIVGGALGMLVMMIGLYLLNRLRKFL